MFFVVRSNNSFNFPLGLTKFIVIVIVIWTHESTAHTGRNGSLWPYSGKATGFPAKGL